MTHTTYKSKRPIPKSVPYWTSVILTATILAVLISQWGLAMLFAYEVFL